MQRAQNAHAYVNAGFLFGLTDTGVIKTAAICFGGISPNFMHAVKTENLLIGHKLYSNDFIQAALTTLESELSPDCMLVDASPEYRKNLALSLFYKFVLSFGSNQMIQSKYKSGGEVLQRNVSSGTQIYDTFKDKWPLTKPVHKYEGLIQCSGEIEYVNDLPKQPNELWAAFVPATVVHAKLGQIDAAAALVIMEYIKKIRSILFQFLYYVHRAFLVLNISSRPMIFREKIILECLKRE